MRPQEVVVSDDEGRHGEGTVFNLESAEWPDVVFECSIKPFDDLFEWSEFGGDFIEVLEADNLPERDLMVFVASFVEEHDGGYVGRVAVGDKGEFLAGVGGPDGFVDGNGCGESFPVIGEVVGGDGVAF